MKHLLITLSILLLSSPLLGKPKSVAFVNTASTAAEWVYFSGASTVAEWVYFSGASSAAEWIYITRKRANADYTICIPDNFEYNEKHIAAIYTLYLKEN